MAVKPRSPLHARIGRRVRQLREAKHITQARLAEIADCSNHFVSGIERGVDSPSLLTLERIALALDTTVAALVEEQAREMSTAAQELVRSLKGEDSPELITALREVVAAYRTGRRKRRRHDA